MTIRPAVADDVAAVAALEAELFGADGWSAASVHEELTGARRHAVVAEESGIVGYAVTLRSDEVVDLQRIAVVAAHRRAGVARRLLGRVRAAAQEGGGQRMLLEVSAENSAAIAFYAAEGFEEIDRRPRYYRDGTDAVVLQLTIGRAA